MIGILDYGVGNIKAFSNIYHFLDIPYTVISNSDQIQNIDRFILPGVGAFDSVMEKLEASNLLIPLEHEVLKNKKPILGVCVGMQIFAESSEEGEKKGLGWIPGKVKKFQSSFENSFISIPQIGWNSILPLSSSYLFKDLEKDAKFYFLHSYYYEPANTSMTISVTEYGQPFASAVGIENIMGTQFHPEKSHSNGIKLLKNFSEISVC
jgi:glutamine amidotransferase